MKKLVTKFKNPYNSCEDILYCKETGQYYNLQPGYSRADKVLTTCYPSEGYYEPDTPVKAGLTYEINGEVVTTLEEGIIRDQKAYEEWENEEFELYQLIKEYKDTYDPLFNRALLIRLFDYMDECHFEKIKAKRKDIYRLGSFYFFE